MEFIWRLAFSRTTSRVGKPTGQTSKMTTRIGRQIRSRGRMALRLRFLMLRSNKLLRRQSSRVFPATTALQRSQGLRHRADPRPQSDPESSHQEGIGSQRRSGEANPGGKATGTASAGEIPVGDASQDRKSNRRVGSRPSRLSLGQNTRPQPRMAIRQKH